MRIEIDVFSKTSMDTGFFSASHKLRDQQPDVATGGNKEKDYKKL